VKVSIVDNVMLKRIRFFASGDLASIVAKTMAIAGLYVNTGSTLCRV